MRTSWEFVRSQSPGGTSKTGHPAHASHWHADAVAHPHRFAGSSFFSACSFISFSLKFLARSYPINNGAFELSAPCRCGRKPEGPRTRILGLVRSYFLPGTHVHPLSVRPRIVWIAPPLLFLWPTCMDLSRPCRHGGPDGVCAEADGALFRGARPMAAARCSAARRPDGQPLGGFVVLRSDQRCSRRQRSLAGKTMVARRLSARTSWSSAFALSIGD